MIIEKDLLIRGRDAIGQIENREAPQTTRGTNPRCICTKSGNKILALFEADFCIKFWMIFHELQL